MRDKEKYYDVLDSLFIYCCYYLDKKGYQIEQFPEMPHGQFRTIDYKQLSCEIFTEHDVKEFRKKLHAFRHSSKETLIERNQYSEIQKNFFIQYGIAILCLINDYINEKSY